MNIITGTTGLTLNDIALTRENGDLCFFADSVASIDVSLFFHFWLFCALQILLSIFRLECVNADVLQDCSVTRIPSVGQAHVRKVLIICRSPVLVRLTTPAIIASPVSVLIIVDDRLTPSLHA